MENFIFAYTEEIIKRIAVYKKYTIFPAFFTAARRGLESRDKKIFFGGNDPRSSFERTFYISKIFFRIKNPIHINLFISDVK